MSENSLNCQVFRFLEGEWGVWRSFEGSYKGEFTGKAFFAPDQDQDGTNLYTEAGQLTDGAGQLFDAKQSYLYRLVEDRIQVLKREESKWILMHELNFVLDGELLTASHMHLCGKDHYAVNYRVAFSGSWEQAYTVSGPKNDYTIRSIYER